MYVHRSNRTEVLVDALGAALAEPVAPPLVPEVIVVQSRGMERWLSMQLARRFGVWTNAAFPFPRAFVEQVFAAVTGEARPETDPYAPSALVWSVLAALPAHLGRPSFAPLARYLADDPRGTRRFQLARRIADCFDQYVVYRPEMVRDWEAGGGAEDGWQPELWRALVANLGDGHTAAVASRFFAAIRSGADPGDALPARVCVFGIPALPPLYLRVLEAVSTRRPVHLFLLSPTRHYWGDLQSPREITRAVLRVPVQLGLPGLTAPEETPGSRPPDGAPGARPPEGAPGAPGGARSAGPGTARLTAAGAGGPAPSAVAAALHLVEGHPLLASLGQLGRDFQQVLEEGGAYVEPAEDLYREPGERSLLTILQSDLLDLRRRGEAGDAPRARLAQGDRSIAVHACHSPLREVEVLRDQLLALFDGDPSLAPEDVVVMTPDIEAYAPLVEAVFGSDDGGVRIPYRIADRSMRRDNAVVDAFLGALELARGRLPASAVLDWLALAPVYTAFGIAADELETIRRWVADSGIRWGVDETHREEHGQPRFRENTWRFGLDRLLLGYAAPGEGRRLFGGTLAYDEVEGHAGDLLGRFAEACETLFARLAELETPRPLALWRDTLRATLDSLVSSDGAFAAGHRPLREAFDELVAQAGRAGFAEPVDLDVLRALLTARFDAGHPTLGFLSGGVTFCAMLPMRSVPFRVVYLLGLNDGAFPRSARPPGFDLVARRPRPGDRSRRADDRYLFLEALLQARERLVLSYVGRDIRDDAELPPSVVVSELLDALGDGFAPPGTVEPGTDPGEALRAQLVVRHPMQPFSPRYFDGERDGRLFSYAGAAQRGAAALRGPRHDRPPFLSRPLPPPPEEALATVTLAQLVRFLCQPVEGLLRERLGVVMTEETSVVDDREPLELDGLARYAISTPLLERRLGGEPLAQCLSSVRAAGLLPLGAPGELLFSDLADGVEPLAAAVAAARAGEPFEPVGVRLVFEGTTLSGPLADVFPHALVRCRSARVSPKHLLEAWVHHLALCAEDLPGWPDTTLVVGRHPDGPPVVRYRLAPVADAAAHLAGLVGLWRRGQTAPLPLFLNTSYTFAAWRRRSGLDQPPDRAWREARQVWQGSEWREGESAAPAHRLVFGEGDPLTPEFAAVAEQAFLPLLAHLVEENPAGADGTEVAA